MQGNILSERERERERDALLMIGSVKSVVPGEREEWAPGRSLS